MHAGGRKPVPSLCANLCRAGPLGAGRAFPSPFARQAQAENRGDLQDNSGLLMAKWDGPAEFQRWLLCMRSNSRWLARAWFAWLKPSRQTASKAIRKLVGIGELPIKWLLGGWMANGETWEARLGDSGNGAWPQGQPTAVSGPFHGRHHQRA